ncbi:helix-turn-helix transcriptional regulator [uncultured Oscillibacter sp.]|uniref:helix-turn-helix domain-containing protein n=1 Tax=uncultured Oscillibacter sp. TaxID=876091 RepID=UPI0028051884|nr:helix-turn-helix transcriptional regulator [uncultured Oscillibacter sp.]
MNQTKTIADLMSALTETLSERDTAKAIIKADISSTIASTRIKSGLSQAQLAEKIGKTQGTISKWEAGDTNFTVDLLVDIAADLDLNLTIKLQKPVNKSFRLMRTDYHTPSKKVCIFPTTYNGFSDFEELKEM